MPPQTPLLLVDSVYDTYNLYPSALLTATSEVVGKEAFHVADYKRDRSWWQPTTDGGGSPNYAIVDLGAGVQHGVDFLWIDRGHNLWGKVLSLEGDLTGTSTWTIGGSFGAVPAVGTVGGDPTTGWSVTEEGALWRLYGAPLTACRKWRFGVAYVAAFVPIVTGLMVGLKTQLLGYSTVFDEDAGERNEATETSRAGYRGSSMIYSWRTAELGLAYIGATEYDATMRQLRQLLFQKGQPFALFLDYGTRPERGWLFQYEGSTWAQPKSKYYRAGRIRAREVGAALP